MGEAKELPDHPRAAGDPTTGTATFAASVPNTSSLVGLTVYHQMLPAEADASGNLVAITATNALQLVIGVF